MVAQKNRGDTVNLSLTSTNTGNATCTFYYGSSLKSPTGVIVDNTIQPLSLTAGSSGTKSWADIIPLTWETGVWQVRMSVWSQDPLGGANTSAVRLADTGWVDGFNVIVPSVCTAAITATTVT
jgi:hypothetical protein